VGSLIKAGEQATETTAELSSDHTQDQADLFF
jgi:hypothetical protein